MSTNSKKPLNKVNAPKGKNTQDHGAAERFAKEIEARFGSRQSKRGDGDQRRPKSGKGV